MIGVVMTQDSSSKKINVDTLRMDKKDWMQEKYCAVLQDGIIVIMKGGSRLTGEVTLENGNRITSDGTVILKDGTRKTLKAGDCMDMSGNLTRKVLN